MRSCWRRLLGKSQRSVHVISDLVLRFTCCDSSSMSIDVATFSSYALRSSYALYALRSGSVNGRFTLRTLYAQLLVLRSTSTYRHVNRWIFSRDAGRTKSKPVDARSRSFMSMCLLWLQRSRTPPGCAGVYELNTHSRPAKLATHLTPLPVCVARLHIRFRHRAPR